MSRAHIYRYTDHQAMRHCWSMRSMYANELSEDAGSHQTPVQALWQQIRHEEAGVYVNFLENKGADHPRAAYSEATFERLAAVKQTYDPRNLFQFNQNVPPARA